MNLLIEKDFESIGHIFQEQNIGYVIENHEYLPDKALTYMNAYGFMASQSAEYKTALVGPKIRDFGTRYTLYRINPAYAAPTVFLTGEITDHITQVQNVAFTQRNDTVYEVDLVGLSSPANLVFLEPYNALWRLSLINDNRVMMLTDKPTLAYAYGNSWHIDPAALQQRYPEFIQSDGSSYHMRLRISFWPDRLTIPALIISIIFAVGIIIYFFV